MIKVNYYHSLIFFNLCVFISAFESNNVIITPHTAFFSKSSNEELQKRTAQEVVRVINSKQPENFINPEVINNSRLKLV